LSSGVKWSVSSIRQDATSVFSRSARMDGKWHRTSHSSISARLSGLFLENIIREWQKGSSAFVKRFRLLLAPLAIPRILPKSAVEKVTIRSDSP